MSDLDVTESFFMNEEKKNLLKQTVCRNASDSELQLFIHVCIRTGLDPFMKQIYSIQRGSIRTIQTGIDGLRLIAERTGKYAPGREGTYTYTAEGHLVSATAYIKKMTSDGTWHEISATAFFQEYNPGNNPIWKKMPHVMLLKCSEANALRKAFPGDMSGIYTKEEMDQADKNPVQEEVEIPEIETQVQSDNILSRFIEDGDFDPSMHFDVRNFMSQYCKELKKTMRQATEKYCDKIKFLVTLEKWKARELEKCAISKIEK